MAVHVVIPSQFVAEAGGNDAVEVNGATVREALDHLIAQHPDLGERLFADGRLKRFINLYVDDEDIRLLNDLDTELDDGAELTILPAIAGGRRMRGVTS